MTSATSRYAAIAAAVLPAAITIVHVLSAGGSDLALSTLSSDSVEMSSGLQVFSAIVAVLAICAIVDILVLRAHPERGTLRVVTGVMIALLLIGGPARVGASPVVGVTAIVLGVLLWLVLGRAPTSR